MFLFPPETLLKTISVTLVVTREQILPSNSLRRSQLQFCCYVAVSREKNPPLSLARTVGIFGHFPRYLIHSGVAVLLCSVSFTFSLSLSLSPTFYRAMRKSHSHATSSFHTATDHGPLRYPTRYPDVYDAPTGLIVFFCPLFSASSLFFASQRLRQIEEREKGEGAYRQVPKIGKMDSIQRIRENGTKNAEKGSR